MARIEIHVNIGKFQKLKAYITEPLQQRPNQRIPLMLGRPSPHITHLSNEVARGNIKDTSIGEWKDIDREEMDALGSFLLSKTGERIRLYIPQHPPYGLIRVRGRNTPEDVVKRHTQKNTDLKWFYQSFNDALVDTTDEAWRSYISELFERYREGELTPEVAAFKRLIDIFNAREKSQYLSNIVWKAQRSMHANIAQGVRVFPAIMKVIPELCKRYGIPNDERSNEVAALYTEIFGNTWPFVAENALMDGKVTARGMPWQRIHEEYFYEKTLEDMELTLRNDRKLSVDFSDDKKKRLHKIEQERSTGKWFGCPAVRVVQGQDSLIRVLWDISNSVARDFYQKRYGSRSNSSQV